MPLLNAVRFMPPPSADESYLPPGAVYGLLPHAAEQPPGASVAPVYAGSSRGLFVPSYQSKTLHGLPPPPHYGYTSGYTGGYTGGYAGGYANGYTMAGPYGPYHHAPMPPYMLMPPGMVPGMVPGMPPSMPPGMMPGMMPGVVPGMVPGVVPGLAPHPGAMPPVGSAMQGVPVGDPVGHPTQRPPHPTTTPCSVGGQPHISYPPLPELAGTGPPPSAPDGPPPSTPTPSTAGSSAPQMPTTELTAAAPPAASEPDLAS